MKYKIPHYKVRLVKETTKTYELTHCNGAEDSLKVCQKLLKGLPHEEIVLVMLNNQNAIIGSCKVSQGGQSGAAILPADIFRPALAAAASRIILAHNHPSGDPTPSPQDIDSTKKTQHLGELLGICLLDHLVITNSGRHSSIMDYI